MLIPVSLMQEEQLVYANSWAFFCDFLTKIVLLPIHIDVAK